MKICLVEDDFMLAKAISKFFELKKYTTVQFYNGNEAYDHISQFNQYDLFILDINLQGDINGLEILKLIRNFHSDVPVIIITASSEYEPLELAFKLGCTEYIKKPFNLKELELRVDKSINQKMKKFFIGDEIYFDFITKSLFYNEVEIELRKKEKRALEILIKNFNFIVSIETLEDYIWEGEIKESYPLRQLINTIRNKLPINFIKTEVGIGYKAGDIE